MMVMHLKKQGSSPDGKYDPSTAVGLSGIFSVDTASMFSLQLLLSCCYSLGTEGEPGHKITTEKQVTVSK